MDTQLSMIPTLDASLEAARTVEMYTPRQLEQWAAILKLAGYHVYPRGHVQNVTVTRSIDAYMMERIADQGSAELNKFMDYVHGVASREIGDELFRHGYIAKTSLCRTPDYRYQVDHTVLVVDPRR